MSPTRRNRVLFVTNMTSMVRAPETMGEFREMAVALRQTAPAGDTLRRYAKSQVVELEKVLAAAAGKGHGGVHKARRRLKALRSFLRMLRPAIGDDAFRDANAALRTAGHALAGARKAGAMIEAADKLAGSTPKDRLAELQPILTAIRAAAEADAAAHAGEDQVTGGAGVALDEVRRVRHAIHDWRLPKREVDFYVDGLRKVYARAKRLLDDGLATGDTVVLHEARKSVIHLRYLLDLLDPVWPALFRAWSKEVQALREVLGDINDLHDMELLIAQEGSAFAAMPEKDKALALIASRRAALIEAVKPFAHRLYSESPANFALRIAALWKSWAKHDD
jgi:CHAD domain-containing protein